MALLTHRESIIHASNPVGYPHPHLAISTFFYSTIESILRTNPHPQGTVMAHDRTHLRLRSMAPANDIFRLATLFVPLHINNNHWASAVIDFRALTISFLDSMNGNGQPHLDRLIHFLQLEYQAFHHATPPDWAITHTPTPQQENGYDCGVYTCLFANRTMQQASLKVSPESITTFREHIAISIITNSAFLG
jgi:Ulp1 family protease